MEVAIIGAGNVAHILGRKIKAAGHTVSQVLSRSLPLSLAGELKAEPITDYAALSSGAGLYLLAVNDSALATVVARLPAVIGIIAHTAGALPLSVLATSAGRYGVLYPLQSLRKEKKDYDVIPLLTDGSDTKVLQTLTDFAETISNKVETATDEQRLKLHTAAVAVSNFTNHLYSLSEDFCRKEGVDFSLLQPLMEEVTFRMRQFSPAQMQTGPAIRGDEATINRHLQLLEKHPQLQQLYEVMTRSIQSKEEGSSR